MCLVIFCLWAKLFPQIWHTRFWFWPCFALRWRTRVLRLLKALWQSRHSSWCPEHWWLSLVTSSLNRHGHFEQLKAAPYAYPILSWELWRETCAASSHFTSVSRFTAPCQCQPETARNVKFKDIFCVGFIRLYQLRLSVEITQGWCLTAAPVAYHNKVVHTKTFIQAILNTVKAELRLTILPENQTN